MSNPQSLYPGLPNQAHPPSPYPQIPHYQSAQHGVSPAHQPPPPQQYGSPPPQPSYTPPSPGYTPPQAGYTPPPAGYPLSQAYNSPSQASYANQHGYAQPQQPGYPYPHPGYVPTPISIPGCPPGLEYLAMVDRLYIKQDVEILEAIIGIECANKYKVFNVLGQQLYYAGEESDCCSRNFIGPDRGFMLHIYNAIGQEVIRFSRDCRCCAHINLCGSCCGHIVTAEAPVGHVIGQIVQKSTCVRPFYGIMDSLGSEVLEIIGPYCIDLCGICCQYEFEVFQEGQPVGSITKTWSGVLQEFLTDADHFCVSFPMNLPVQIKAMLLGAAFLIDFMFFENHGVDS